MFHVSEVHTGYRNRADCTSLVTLVTARDPPTVLVLSQFNHVKQIPPTVTHFSLKTGREGRTNGGCKPK